VQPLDPAPPGHRLRVAVTGASGPVGSALLRALVAAPGVGSVLALDTVAVEVAGVRSIVVDVCDPAVRTALAGCAVVVHLDPDPVLALVPGARPAGAAAEVTQVESGAPVEGGRSAVVEQAGPQHVADESAARVPAGRAVLAVQTVLTAAAAANVGCAIVVTSAMVYGAGATREVPIAEDAPLNAEPDGQAMRDMLEVERVVALASRAHPGLDVCVVRPAALAGPGVDSAVTRYFEAPRLVTVKGEAMRWQFCHVEDLVSALLALTLRGRGGVATVGCAGWLSQAEVERLADRGHVELPASLAYGTADRLHRMGLSPVPAGQLRFVTRPWVVPSTMLRDLGWRAGWDNADVLGLVLDQAAGHLALAWRRIGRKETATLSAAGATVAVLSTAAIVARARRRHR
jgi:nucleoside-diphosphate-sugar epimerase